MRMRRRPGAAGCSAACSAEVGTVVSEQLRAYLTAAALGAAAGAVYDLLRLVRLRRRRDRRLTHGLDAAFLLLVAPALLWYALRVGRGELRLIMLTAMGETEDRITGLEAGADDYLPKPFEPKELVLRIKNILRRAPQEDGQAVEKLNLGLCCYDMVKKELLTKQGTVIHITPVEQAMLNVLGQKSGQIFTREKLAEILGAGQSPRSIDVQITRLRKKIEKDSKNPRYLQTVRGKGYMLLPE